MGTFPLYFFSIPAPRVEVISRPWSEAAATRSRDRMTGKRSYELVPSLAAGQFPVNILCWNSCRSFTTASATRSMWNSPLDRAGTFHSGQGTRLRALNEGFMPNLLRKPSNNSLANCKRNTSWRGNVRPHEGKNQRAGEALATGSWNAEGELLKMPFLRSSPGNGYQTK